MNTRKLALLSLSTAVVAVSVWFASTNFEREPEPPLLGEPESAADVAAEQPELDPPPAIVETAEPHSDEEKAKQAFAPSLRGTDVDGRLAVDDEGNLKATRDVRDYFDYYLSVVGQRSLEEVIAHIEEQAHASLPDKAAAQAVDLLHDYVDYREAEQAFMARDLSAEQREQHVETLDETLESLMRMRRSHLGQERADAFFATEEAYGRYALERMQVEDNSELTEQERQAQLAAIEKQAPSEITEVRERTTGHVEREQRVEEMREAGASEAEIKAYRARHVGEEEAERMARIDADNAQWEARYERYAQQRRGIEQADGLSATDRQAAIERLRREHFDERGRTRAEVRDRSLN